MSEDRSPTLLMAHVRAPVGYSHQGGIALSDPETEPVLVARTSTEVILVLDDGEEIRFDATELRAAVGQEQ